MATPLVSVNICTWRPHTQYFHTAVASILSQTFRDFELVIVEDPSEVDGRQVIVDLLADKRIRYYRNETRKGLLAQKNQALQLSRAPLVAILDHDDVANSERLQRQAEFLARNPMSMPSVRGLSQSIVRVAKSVSDVILPDPTGFAVH